MLWVDVELWWFVMFTNGREANEVPRRRRVTAGDPAETLFVQESHPNDHPHPGAHPSPSVSSPLAGSHPRPSTGQTRLPPVLSRLNSPLPGRPSFCRARAPSLPLVPPPVAPSYPHQPSLLGHFLPLSSDDSIGPPRCRSSPRVVVAVWPVCRLGVGWGELVALAHAAKPSVLVRPVAAQSKLAGCTRPRVRRTALRLRRVPHELIRQRHPPWVRIGRGPVWRGRRTQHGRSYDGRCGLQPDRQRLLALLGQSTSLFPND